jgi:mono/diheme cytochrome c family protein
MRISDVVAVLLLAACGAPQEAIVPETQEVIPATRDETHGKHLFLRFCYQCHPGGSQGLGPALDDRPITKATIRAQIRAGTGKMPAFNDEWLTDDQVAEIAEYVTTLHRDSIARTAYR